MRNIFFILLPALALSLMACESARSTRLREGLEHDLKELFRKHGFAPAELKCGLVLKPEEGTTCQFNASAEEVSQAARGLNLREVIGGGAPEEGVGRGVCSTESDLYRLKLMRIYEMPAGREITLGGGRSLGRLIVCHQGGKGEGQVVVAYKREAS